MSRDTVGPVPLVSIVIPTYNRADLVAQAVLSSLAQTWPRCETIVVDDGSTAGTQEALAPYRDRVRCLVQDNAGISAARNRGWREASGAYVGFLDSDDLWEPRLVEAALGVFAADPEVDAVCLSEREIDEAGRIHPEKPGPY